MRLFRRFPLHLQHDSMDCGPTCLKMIAEYYGKRFSLPYLRERCSFSKDGVSLLGISEAAEQIGFRTQAVRLPYELDDDRACLLDVSFPCIAYWNQQHFLVVLHADGKNAWVADPASGKIKMTRADFKKGWVAPGAGEGIVLTLEPTPAFYAMPEDEAPPKGLGFLWQYLRPYNTLLTQLLIGLALALVFQMIFPFLAQSVVDVGIENQNIDFIYLILIAQLALFVSQTFLSFIQSRLLLYVGARVNVALLTDFLIKLMRLPIRFFDTKNLGDIMQRIYDQERIEAFLTGSTLTVVFSSASFIVFSGILFFYNTTIFAVFLTGSMLYVFWIFVFLKKRKSIDHARFQAMSTNQETLVELVQGMQEIKLQGSERKRRWQWAQQQAALFRVGLRSLNVAQWQDMGAGFINQSKDILITFIAARAVISGDISLGMMLATQYIVGQLNAPLQQIIGFLRGAQDARLSLDRLNEIIDHPEEEQSGGGDPADADMIPASGDLHLQNVSFRYGEANNDILQNISITIPRGKVTAIVGASGSGKTTLIKLLLGFYQPTQGSIRIGQLSLASISPRAWRRRCGAVMQDGFIFSDTIANNIAESDERVDKKRLQQAIYLANIQDFIESLPLGYHTRIGARGNGLSQGQRQRLLIARAAYKNPEFMFFDEATNALDANNERVIVENLQSFYQNRTVVVVAHRLSTVRYADQIIVLDQGQVIESGTHDELTIHRGAYFHLVKNQLELGV